MSTSMVDKVVIITGASSGIGAQTAVEFAKLGSRVVLTARREKQLHLTAQRCQEVGLTSQKILVVSADMTKDEDLRMIIESTVNAFDTVNILINNAGISKLANFTHATTEDLDRMYQLNTRAVFSLTKLALPYLLKTKGSVVNVSSVASLRPAPHVITYSVSKAAQDQLTRCLALELAPQGVRVNAICPSFIRTEILGLAGFLSDGETEDQFLSRAAKIHPMDRVGTVQEAARAIVFLASDDASFITGCTLPVDGGRYMTSWIMAPKSKL